MSKFVDLTGKVFGKLTVKYRGENTKEGKAMWWCECSCGNKELKLIKSSALKNHTSQSCGCIRKGINKKFNKYEILDNYTMIGYTNNKIPYDFYIDKEDYDLIYQYCWHKHQDGYLRTCIGKTEEGKNIYILMHKLILDDYDNSYEIDHIDGKPNNNKKENLRKVLHRNNMKNCKIYISNKSGQKGVYFSARDNKWKACIGYNNKQIHLGTFISLEDAIETRLKAESFYYGEFMRDENNLLNGTR